MSTDSRSPSNIEEAAKQRVEQLEEQHAQLLAQLSGVRDSLQSLLPGRMAAPSAQQGVASTDDARADGESDTGPETVVVEAVSDDAVPGDDAGGRRRG